MKMKKIICPNCDFENDESITFCINCNSDLTVDSSFTEVTEKIISEVPDEEASEEFFKDIEEFYEGSPVIIVVKGPNKGARFMIERNEVLVGRSAECDIIIDDVTVSRRHARISRKGVDLWIFDLDSLNGIYVNKKRIEKARLKNKDEIQIGKYKFIFITGK